MKSKFYDTIKDAKKIAIFTHVDADADAICSSCALKNLIRNNFDYKFVDVFIDGEIGELYDPIVRSEVINPKPFSSYDLAIVLDSPNLGRLGINQEIIKNIPYIINIDHHEGNDRFANINIVAPKVSSTCELLYLIAEVQGFDMDNIIAKELYQGIITDTNCFTTLNLTARTYRVVSELMKFKFDSEVIKEYYFKNNTKAKTLLLTKALQSMKFYKEDLITTMRITNETLQKVGASFEDTMGIIDNGINISGTAVSAILIEKEPGLIYCSLRSKGQVDVAKIAKEFGGGGNNDKIAAFQISGDIKEIEKKIVDELLPYVNDISTEDTKIF